MSNVVRTLSVAAALFGTTAITAGAATVTVLSQALTTPMLASLAATSTTLPGGSSFDEQGITSGSVQGDYRSPFENLGTGKYESINYFTVGSTTVPGSSTPNTLTFSSVQNSFKILWGSIDTYNRIVFLNGGAQVFVANSGTNVMPVDRRGAHLVTITDLLFDSVRFISTKPSFEFSNIETTTAAVPVPAAGFLMFGAFAGLVALRRRKDV